MFFTVDNGAVEYEFENSLMYESWLISSKLHCPLRYPWQVLYADRISWTRNINKSFAPALTVFLNNYLPLLLYKSNRIRVSCSRQDFFIIKSDPVLIRID